MIIVTIIVFVWIIMSMAANDFAILNIKASNLGNILINFDKYNTYILELDN